MKKQNVNNKLAFNKAAVTELNDNKLTQVNGGTLISPSYVVLAIEIYEASVELGHAISKGLKK
jgi:bacteriocin-like protein